VKVDVLLPWWDRSSIARERSRDWVLRQWHAAPAHYRVTFAVGSGDTWRKGDAVACQLARCTGDIVVVADADVWCPGIAAAVHHVAEERVSWAIPHLLVRRLDRASTNRLLTSEGLPHYSLERAPYEGIRGGGVVVLDRRLARDVPIDSRFHGWGGEDHAWGYALTTLGGEPWRGQADLWHLWHEHAAPGRVAPHIGSMESEYLRRRYFSACNDQAATQQLLDEGRGRWPT
jgi:hypothetical protein